ncbi:MAG TPA: lipocalin-like domain-containing protein [Candidatus Tectomicrobia bacterium]|nr:lipocalin-like domain-containing protein [Candidatus Tectomicrobia bacterium]
MRRILSIAIPSLAVLAILVGVSAIATRRGYELALPGRVLSFPRDHAAHPTFQTEWWYYTGHLRTTDAEEYGYQLTFFRRRIDEENRPSGLSQWAPQHLYMAHFAISDKQRKRLIYAEKINRPTLGMAGADEERLRVWNDEWRAERLGPYHHLQAAMEAFAINLILVPEKGPILHGTDGLSQKGESKGNASHYYSFTRLKTNGVLQVRGAAKEVMGMSWMDHEFSSSSLEPTQVGWDWFSLQLDNGAELMVYLLRHEDGRIDPHSSGTLVHPDGQAEHLRQEMVEVVALDKWTSPRSGATYPQGWVLRVPKAGLDLHITPAFPDQELDTKSSTRVVYWEGSSSVEGSHNGRPVRGQGYVELVGYKEKIDL